MTAACEIPHIALTQLWSSMIRSRMLIDTGVAMRVTPAWHNNGRVWSATISGNDKQLTDTGCCGITTNPTLTSPYKFVPSWAYEDAC